MPRLIRISAIIILSLVILLVAAGIVLTQIINPNDYKPEIVAAVNKATGRELSINGNITLSLFPWLGVDVEDVELSNPQGFGEKAFLKVGEAEIKLQLLPLLVGKVEFGAIVLDHANLYLVKKSTSSDNWSDLTASAKAADKVASNDASSISTEPTKNRSMQKINITTISVQDSYVKYIDATTENVVEVTDLNLDSSNLGMARDFPVYLSFKMTSKKPKLRVQFNAKADAYIDLDKEVYKLESLQANGQLATQTAKNLSFAAKGDFKVDVKNKAWKLADVSANLAQMCVAINSEGDLSNSTGKGSVKVKSFNAQALMQQLKPGIKFSDANALTNVSTEFSFKVTPTHFQIPDLQAKIDNSTLTANFDYQTTKTRSLTYWLQLDKINLDKYQVTMPPKNSSKKASQSNPLLVLGFLTNLDGSGKIQMGTLTYNKIPLKNLLIQSTANNNVINLNPISASVYDGAINAKANLNLKSSIPALTVDATLANLNLGKAFASGGEESRVAGLLNLQTHLNSVGKSPEVWLSNLQGNGSINVKDGVIRGVDLNFWLLQGVSVLKKLTPNLKGNTNQTPFNGMNASFTIYQGILSNQDLLISTQQLSAKGSGTINIPQQTIKYRMFVQSNDTSLLANNMQIPIIITGSIVDPKVQLDMAVLTTSLIRQGLTAPAGIAKAIPEGALDILSKIKF